MLPYHSPKLLKSVSHRLLTQNISTRSIHNLLNYLALTHHISSSVVIGMTRLLISHNRHTHTQQGVDRYWIPVDTCFKDLAHLDPEFSSTVFPGNLSGLLKWDVYRSYSLSDAEITLSKYWQQTLHLPVNTDHRHPVRQITVNIKQKCVLQQLVLGDLWKSQPNAKWPGQNSGSWHWDHRARI